MQLPSQRWWAMRIFLFTLTVNSRCQMLPVDGDVKQEQEQSRGRSCTSTLGAGREITCGDAICAPEWFTDIILRVRATFGVSYHSSRKLLEMPWYLKVKGQTVTPLEYDTSWWRLGLTSVVFPGSWFEEKLSSAQLHTLFWESVPPLFALHSVHFLLCGVLIVQEENSNPLQNHNCTFHLQLVSIFPPIHCQYDMTTVIIRETERKFCLSLLGKTSLDPWAGYFCSKQYRKQLGLNFLPVHSVLMMKTLHVFCFTPVCTLPFMGMQKQVMVLHKTITYSAVDTVLINLEKHTPQLASLVFLWLKTIIYILVWLLFCWSWADVKYNACDY